MPEAVEMRLTIPPELGPRLRSSKVRAAFQRAKVRDLYDLHGFATAPFDGELLSTFVDGSIEAPESCRSMAAPITSPSKLCPMSAM